MFDLGNYLPYLINRAGVRVAAKFTQDVRPKNVGLQEWRVLAAIACHGTQRMSALADLTSIDRTTLSRLAARMESGGHVARLRAEDDGREVHIALTAQGEAIARDIIPLAEHYEKVALSGFSQAEAEALKSMLKRVYGNMDRL